MPVNERSNITIYVSPELKALIAEKAKVRGWSANQLVLNLAREGATAGAAWEKENGCQADLTELAQLLEAEVPATWVVPAIGTQEYTDMALDMVKRGHEQDAAAKARAELRSAQDASDARLRALEEQVAALKAQSERLQKAELRKIADSGEESGE